LSTEITLFLKRASGENRTLIYTVTYSFHLRSPAIALNVICTFWFVLLHYPTPVIPNVLKLAVPSLRN